MAQGAWRQAENPGRAAVALDDPAGLLEHTEDVFSLDHLQTARASGGRCRGAARSDAKVEVQNRIGGEDDGAFEHVLQLADVARPRVCEQSLHGPRADPVDALADAMANLSTRKWTSRGMSSVRSRSGGRWMGKTLSR